MDVVLQRKGQAGRAGPQCVWPMCHVCGRRPTPPCVGGRGPLGCQLRPPALQETRPSQVRPCLLPLLGAFVNSGLSITKAPKRRKLNHGGGPSPPTLPLQKVINVMRAEDGGRRPVLCVGHALCSARVPAPCPAPPRLSAPHRMAAMATPQPSSLAGGSFPRPPCFPGPACPPGRMGVVQEGLGVSLLWAVCLALCLV